MATAPLAPAGLRLGVDGFSYPDLCQPDRLRALHDRFDDEVRQAAPAFWARWDDYRRSPDAARPATETSALLVEMAAHVSAFVARLFGVESELAAIREDTRRQDPLFRFKVDFVRRRVLPMLKGRRSRAAPRTGSGWRG